MVQGGRIMAKKNNTEKSSYVLRATHFYTGLIDGGYFNLQLSVDSWVRAEDKEGNTNWEKKNEWGITNSAWDTIIQYKLNPLKVFLHPKVFSKAPKLLKYYRCLALLPHKGMADIVGSDTKEFETGESRMTEEKQNKVVFAVNSLICNIIAMSPNSFKKQIQGIVFTTAGATLQGSWVNHIGDAGERFVRSTIFTELAQEQLVTSITKKNNDRIIIKCDNITKVVEQFKDVNIVTFNNGAYMTFQSDPDILFYDDLGEKIAVLEIKAGTDKGGAKERWGAAVKTIDEQKTQNSKIATYLVDACITDTVNELQSTGSTIDHVFEMQKISDDESYKKRFIGLLKKDLKLV